MEFELFLPGEISEYLGHIGPVQDPFGVTWVPQLDVTFSPRTFQGITGGGPAISRGHVTRWETYPMPLIAFLKLHADLQFSYNLQSTPLWQLPEEIAPARSHWLHPNRHLVGYQPAERLAPPHLDTLRECGFTADSLAVTNVLDFPFNLTAVRIVSNTLHACFPIEVLYGLPREARGSLLQLPFCEWTQEPHNYSTDFAIRAYTRSFFTFPAQVLRKANLFRFRLLRASVLGQCGLCYNWNDAFPKSFHAYYQLARTEMDIFQPLPFSYLNWSRYVLSPEDDSSLLKDYIKFKYPLADRSSNPSDAAPLPPVSAPTPPSEPPSLPTELDFQS